MATVNKDFKIKSGLVVEGTNATVNGNQILTETAGDQYILNLIGGETLVKSVESTQLEVDQSGKLAVKANVFDAYGDADAAEIAANQYTDIAINGALETAAGYANTAENNANSYTDTAIGNIPDNYITSTSTDFAVNNGMLEVGQYSGIASKTYADNAASSAQQNAESYTDTAVANLVDSAPALLDTLNELAAALGDSPDTITNLTTSIGEKVAKSGDTMTGELVLFGAPTQGNAAATKAYVDDVASTTYNDALAAAGTNAQGYANTAEQNAKDYADGLTTADIAEGTPGGGLYFTDARAITAIDSAISGGTQTNISVSYNTGTGKFDFVAENGVADSTTTDLAEGSNLYFTDQRAIDAIAGSGISPLSVEINNYRTEQATQQYVSNASTVNVHTFAYPYESVKYLVRVVGWDGGVKHSQITEILMTVDGNNNIAMTEYGNVHTSTSPLASFSATYDSGNYILTATTAVSGCEIIAAATMLSWAD